ncbi:unnamed protein product [Symbiodinium sp. CCMP2592]|nr:unnamed protein product [Symbiodinium sp. CCMP2592]
MTGPTTSRSSGEWSWRGRGKPRPVAPGLVDRYGDRAGDRGDRGRSSEASWETSDWKAKKSSWPSARWESAVKHRHKESWPTLWGWWSRSSGGWYGRSATQGREQQKEPAREAARSFDGVGPWDRRNYDSHERGRESRRLTWPGSYMPFAPYLDLLSRRRRAQSSLEAVPCLGDETVLERWQEHIEASPDPEGEAKRIHWLTSRLHMQGFNRVEDVLPFDEVQSLAPAEGADHLEADLLEIAKREVADSTTEFASAEALDATEARYLCALAEDQGPGDMNVLVKLNSLGKENLRTSTLTMLLTQFHGLKLSKLSPMTTPVKLGNFGKKFEDSDPGLDLLVPDRDTWHARGLSTKIDFMFFRAPGMDFQLTVRDDLTRRCGKWMAPEVIESIAKQASFRPPNLRYQDGPDIRAFEVFRGPLDPDCWELAASNRDAWKQLESKWISKWISPINTACSSTDLMNMQLLVLNAKLCVLRPVREELFEKPYSQALLQVKEANRLSVQRALLVRFEQDQGVSVLLLMGTFAPHRVTLVQQPPQEQDLLGNVARGLLVVWHLAKLLFDDDPLHKPAIFLPQVMLQHPLFTGVVNSSPARNLMYRLGQLDILDFVQVLPSKLPPKYEALLQYILANELSAGKLQQGLDDTQDVMNLLRHDLRTHTDMLAQCVSSELGIFGAKASPGDIFNLCSILPPIAPWEDDPLEDNPDLHLLAFAATNILRAS